MKKTASLIRALILLSLFLVAAFLIFCGPDDSDPAWLRIWISSKLYGFILMIGVRQLARAWNRDAIIRHYTSHR